LAEEKWLSRVELCKREASSATNEYTHLRAKNLLEKKRIIDQE
jgi:hypothetical protein